MVVENPLGDVVVELPKFVGLIVISQVVEVKVKVANIKSMPIVVC